MARYKQDRLKQDEMSREQEQKYIALEANYFAQARNYKSTQYEKQWMINTAYYKGWHNLKWDNISKRLVWDQRDPLKFYINYVYATVRVVRNSLLRDQPTWDVDTRPYKTGNQEEMRVWGGFITNQAKKLKLKQKLKTVITYGLINGQGIIQYGYDKLDGIWIDTPDPFDVYIDPLATDIKSARYVIKVIRRAKEDVQKNKNYKNTERIGGSNKISESEYKEQLKSKLGEESGGDSVLLHEMWYKDEEGKVCVVTVCDGYLLRREETDFKELPFILYLPDINPNEIYSEGWVKNIIPINKALNTLERNILEYNVLFSKGRFIMDRGAKVNAVTNENGQIIKVNRGYRFEQLDMKPMSSTPFNQIGNLMRYMQDMGAAHDALMGRAPTGVSAAVAFEQLVQNASLNFSDLIDNLVITLEELGEKIMELGYKYLDTIEEFKVQNPDGTESIYRVTGENGEASDDVIKIPKSYDIRVSIAGGLAQTKAGKQDVLFRLRANRDIDRRTLLLELGQDADTIEKRLAQELQSGVSFDKNGQPIAGVSVQGQTQELPETSQQEQGQTNAVPGDISQLDISVLSPEAQNMVKQFMEEGYTLSQEFVDNPELLEALVKEEVDADIDANNVVYLK